MQGHLWHGLYKSSQNTLSRIYIFCPLSTASLLLEDNVFCEHINALNGPSMIQISTILAPPIAISDPAMNPIPPILSDKGVATKRPIS